MVGGSWVTVHALAAGRMWTSADDADSFDVAMVMGAAVWNGEPSPYLQGRLDRAVDLWNQGKVKVIIVSGSTSDNEPATMAAYLEDAGVDPDRIVQDLFGNNSYASCARAAQFYEVDKLVVVSQTYHLPRTIAGCRMLGIDAYGLGDERDHDALWLTYQLREIGANVKLIADVLTGTDAHQEGYDPAVHDSLEKS